MFWDSSSQSKTSEVSKNVTFVLALNIAHVLALNTAHVLRLEKADVLALNNQTFFCRSHVSGAAALPGAELFSNKHTCF